MKGTLVLEDSTLLTLAKELRYTSHFPFLIELGRKAAELPSCRSCLARKQIKSDLERAKQVFLTMDQRKIDLLKNLAGAKKVVIVTAKGGRKER